MRPGHRPLRTLALTLVVQGLVFWTVLAAIGPGAVAGETWLVLHAVLAIALVLLHSRPGPTAHWNARTWLVVALYAMFLAAIFAGANFALDALHGIDRPRAEVAAHLGGLELWQALCPGIFSLAVGALVGGLAGQQWPARRRLAADAPHTPQ